jgi:hypothetical protein
VRTGETLSRRQYDQKYGRIARTGFRTEYQQKKAETTKWKSFYVEHFIVRNGDQLVTWRKLIERVRELGHRRMFISAFGEAGVDYPAQRGQMIWASTVGFYGDANIKIAPGSTLYADLPAPGERLGALVTNDLEAWVWYQFVSGNLVGETISEFVLRWQA